MICLDGKNCSADNHSGIPAGRADRAETVERAEREYSARTTASALP
jgi:hypothetical protein